jgi:hypothetical protein
VIWALPGFWCTVDPVANVAAAAVGATAIATAAAPTATSGAMRFMLMCIVIPISFICLLRSMMYSRIVLDDLDVVLAATHP